jgi:hypothetical protein
MPAKMRSVATTKAAPKRIDSQGLDGGGFSGSGGSVAMRETKEAQGPYKSNREKEGVESSDGTVEMSGRCAHPVPSS